MSRLTVYLHGAPVGLLEQDATGALRFTYTPEWLAREDAEPLSRMLPLSADPYDGRHAHSFFAGVLPEEGPPAAVALSGNLTGARKTP
jgi:serine/threonine-protein kinase HipA